ncbi:MAG: aminodeoxychorismate synthase component I [Gemmatimonadota bacterium]
MSYTDVVPAGTHAHPFDPAGCIRFDSLDPVRGARSFVFERLSEELVATSLDEVGPALEHASRRVTEGAYAAGYLSYEAAPAFDAALAVQPPVPGLPLLWFGIFEDRREIRPLEGLADAAGTYRLGPITPSLDRDHHAERVRRILDLIAGGDTYQVNLTFRLRGDFDGSPLALYRDLVTAQRSAFCAYLPIGSHTLVSASPELFFRYQGSQIELRPMKGTRPRGRWSGEDDEIARSLAASPKDRAENLMIVDLLRNDLGRVAEFGSVSVPTLFEVERYPTIHQLTSTVIGELREGVRPPEILRALFPSGSITGAPKIRTTEIIRDLEDSPRGPYTGAIGFFGPGEGAFSVAIRTVVIDRMSGRMELGVGSGITADSEPGAEYIESLEKGAFLRHRPAEFELLESLRLEIPGGYTLLDAHIDRLRGSARYFGFAVDEGALRSTLGEAASTLPEGVYKVRLLVDRLGSARVTSEPISADSPSPVLALASQPVDESDPFLYHKTTRRTAYARALEDDPDADEIILFNSRGELTETTTSNLVLRLDGRLVTPPVESGLLAGTLRGKLLEEGAIDIRVLTKDDLARASEVLVANSVRGLRRGVLPAG